MVSQQSHPSWHDRPATAAGADAQSDDDSYSSSCANDAIKRRYKPMSSTDGAEGERNDEYELLDLQSRANALVSTQLSTMQMQITGLQDTVWMLEAAFGTKPLAIGDTKRANKAVQSRTQDSEPQTTELEDDNDVLRIRKHMVETKHREPQMKNQMVESLEGRFCRVERERDAARSDREALRHKVSSLEEHLADVQLERRIFHDNIVDLEDEANDYQQQIRDLENIQIAVENDYQASVDDVIRLEIEIDKTHDKVQYLEKKVKAMKEKPFERERKDGLYNALLQTSDGLDYETLDGLDLAVPTKCTEVQKASTSSRLLRMTSGSVTQTSMFRNDRQEHLQKLNEKHVMNSSFNRTNRKDDESSKNNALIEENAALAEEACAYKTSFENLQHALYARESRALSAERKAEQYQKEIFQLINANHCLQSKSADLVTVYDGYNTSVVELQDTIDRLKTLVDESRSTSMDTNASPASDENKTYEAREEENHKQKKIGDFKVDITADRDDKSEEITLLQTKTLALRRANSVVEKSLTRLTTRTPLHQDKGKQIASVQTPLRRRKDDFDEYVAKSTARDDIGNSMEPSGHSHDTGTCMVANTIERDPTVSKEERQDGVDDQMERE